MNVANMSVALTLMSRDVDGPLTKVESTFGGRRRMITDVFGIRMTFDPEFPTVTMIKLPVDERGRPHLTYEGQPWSEDDERIVTKGRKRWFPVVVEELKVASREPG